jgi:hypothetical protein
LCSVGFAVVIVVTDTASTVFCRMSAKVLTESQAFQIPNSEVRVRIVSRDRRIPDDDCITAVKPAYLTTCYDELTRNYITLTVGESLTEEVETVKYPFDKDTAITSLDNFPELDGSATPSCSPVSVKESVIPATEMGRIPVLQHFADGDVSWLSTLRTVPPNTKHLLNRYPSSDYNVFLRYDMWRAQDCAVSAEPFEPLFATFAYYHVRDKRATRISETFKADLTPPVLKERIFESVTTPAGNSDLVTRLTMCVCALPEQLKKNELYLVVQVHKVLSGDTSAALAPYLRSGYGATGLNVKDMERFSEACKRLKNYRQQIGIGAVHVFDDARKISPAVKNIQIYATRSSINDDHIGEVRGSYPVVTVELLNPVYV